MKKEGELWKMASQLVGESSLAIMATADGSGWPHTAWMNVIISPEMDEVVAVTMPGTEKVANLNANPKAEWAVSSPSRESFVYLSGPTEILSGDEAREYWDSMPGKSVAYYRNAAGGDSDDPADYAVIRTRVQKIVHCRAIGYRKTILLDLDAE